MDPYLDTKPGKQSRVSLPLSSNWRGREKREKLVFFNAGKSSEKFPEKIEDFSPASFDGSERLIDFFGRW